RELAARHDHCRAADEHAVDLAVLAVHTRVQLRRAPDLGALRDLDLLAVADQPVTGEKDRQRPGRRPGGGILGNAVLRHEHPGLPAVALAGEAVDTVRGRGPERLGVRTDRPDGLWRVERQVDVARAEIAALDRQLHALDTDRRQDRGRILDPAQFGDRLFHA